MSSSQPKHFKMEALSQQPLETSTFGPHNPIGLTVDMETSQQSESQAGGFKCKLAQAIGLSRGNVTNVPTANSLLRPNRRTLEKLKAVSQPKSQCEIRERSHCA